MNKLYLVYLLSLLILVPTSIGAYDLYHYQQIVTEEAVLAEERCRVIHPLIQKEKEAFDKWYNVYQASPHAESLPVLFTTYLISVKTRDDTDEQWLVKDDSFLANINVTKFTSKESYAVETALYDYYQADFDSNIATLDYFSYGLNSENEFKYKERVFEATTNLKQVEQRYYQKLALEQKHFDIRSYLIKNSTIIFEVQKSKSNTTYNTF